MGGAYLGLQQIKSSLPKIVTVKDYEPLLVTKVFDRNNKKIGEFFREKRVLIPFDKIPKNVINAFLAAEDDSFYSHSGVNYVAILRAAVANFRAGRTVQGASTITQQVARSLLLTNEKTITRKIKEALLAHEMERHLSKEDILYLYLNQIYFGNGAYGIAMASEVYFRKPVEKMTLGEMAMLAGLPKAPSAYSPVKNPVRSKERQVYVLNRMADVGFITKNEATEAAKQEVRVFLRENYQEYAPFFLETIRQLLVKQIGEAAVLDQGLRVYTSLDLDKQIAAQKSVEKNLKDIDKRQGFRGPSKNITDPKEVGEFLLSTRNRMIVDKFPERIILPEGRFKEYGPLDINYDLKAKGLPNYYPLNTESEAVVSKVDDELGLVFVRSAELEGVIDIESMQWARKPDPEKKSETAIIKKPSEALKMGDIILVKLVSDRFSSARLSRSLSAKKKTFKDVDFDPNRYVKMELEQTPELESALLSIDQQTQDIVAMVGGLKFENSQFNRALQAARQTGSSFKTLVYAAGLDYGYTPASTIVDAPIVFESSTEDSEGQEESSTWKPSNHSKGYVGDITFRNALVKSLNIPSIKIIEKLTVPVATEYSQRLGIFSPLNPDFTLVLGSSSVTLYEMTKAFSQFGRLGKRTRPVVIHKVLDHNGNPLTGPMSLDLRYEKETADIEKKFDEKRKAYLDLIQSNPEEARTKVPDSLFFFEDPDQLIRPTTAYLITTILKAAVEERGGTGGRARAVGREVAGKTGSTNGYYDGWFIGYSPQIATGVWVGFDHEKTIGKGEVGGRTALPIWVDYMKVAHENLPQVTFPVPNGIVFANIDSDTGQLASVSSKNVVRQAFLEGTEPSSSSNRKEEEADFYKRDLSE